MKLTGVEYGIFPEIEKYNENFHPGSHKLRFLIDTSHDSSLLGHMRELDLDLFSPFFTTLSFHQCGCGKHHAQREHSYEFEASDTIVSVSDNVDIAHYMEHMVLDLQYQLGIKTKISGVTVKHAGSAVDFETYVECDDLHLGIFSMNIVLAMMHQALYCGVIDPRYHTVLAIAKWLNERADAAVTLSEVSKTFNIDGAMVHFCFNTLNVFHYPMGAATLPRAETPQTNGPILIIEDNDQTRSLLDDALTDLGYETMTAADGRTGLAMLCKYNASIVLLDVYLPDTDGVSIAKWILESQPSTAVVLMSGKIEMEEGETFSNDAVRFIPKPFSMKHLENVLQMAHC
jgi:CheY-like chemotaxis protein